MPDFDTENQEVEENFNLGTSLVPKFVKEFWTNNFIQRTFSLLLGWSYTLNKPFKLKCNSAGELIVATTGSAYESNDTKIATSADAYSGALGLDQTCSRIDIWVTTFGLTIQRTIDGILWQDAIEIPVNTFYSFDASTLDIQVKNTTPGSNADYQIVGWY